MILYFKSDESRMDVIKPFLVFLLIFLFFKGSCSNGHFGKQFFISYFRTLNLVEDDAYFLVTSDEASVQVEVSLRISSRFIVKKTRLVTTGKVIKISFIEDFRQSGLLVNPLVEVVSLYPVSVTVFIISNNTRASYLALPVHVLDSEYRVVTFGETGRSACLATSFLPHTHVTLNLNRDYKDFVIYLGDEFINVNGRREIISLDTKEVQFEQIYFESSTDLSGMLVKSNNPLSLVCGDLDGEAIRSMEQIFPSSVFGTKFHAYPRMVNIQSSLKFIAHYNCSDIRIGQHTFKMDAGDVRVLPWEDVSYSKIVSDAPFLIAQLFWTGHSRKRQESMALVPSVDQYLRQYSFPRNFQYQYRLYIGVLAFVDFIIKQENRFKSFFETRSNGFFMHKDRNGVTVEVESPFSTPFLAYSFRTDLLSSRANGGDIMTNPVGFNFTEKVTIPDHVKKRNGCVSEKDTNPSSEGITDKTTAAIVQDVQETQPLSPKTQSTSSKSQTTSPKTQTSTPDMYTYSGDITTGWEFCNCQIHEQHAPVTYVPETTTMTVSQLEEKLKRIKRDLAIDKNSLSSARRRKISANDSRLSAKGIGFVGVIILCFVIGFITLMDMPLFLAHALIVWENIVGRPIEKCHRNVVRPQSQ